MKKVDSYYWYDFLPLNLQQVVSSKKKNDITRIDACKEIVCGVATKALTRAISAKGRYFDAQVGETGCLKRAVAVVEWLNGESSDALKARCQKTLAKLGPAGAEVRISRKERFLILSHLLVIIQEPQGKNPAKTNPERLRPLLSKPLRGVSKATLKGLTWHAQSQLSGLSMRYLCKIAAKLTGPDAAWVQKLLSKTYQRSTQSKTKALKRNLVCGACLYEEWAGLLRQCQLNNPILVTVDRFRADIAAPYEQLKLVYWPTKRQLVSLVDDADLSGSKVLMVVRAYQVDESMENQRTYLNKLNRFALPGDTLERYQGFELAFVLNAAQHPQYPGKLDKEPLGEAAAQTQVATWRKLANRHGCAETNKSLFYVLHIYPSSVKAFREGKLCNG